MFYARYLTYRTNPLNSERIVLDERWIAIDAGKETIANERAKQLRPPKDRIFAEDAEIEITVYDERDMLDLRLDRAFLLEKLEDRNPGNREAALAEIINLIREYLHDIRNRLRIRDEDGIVNDAIRIKGLFAALDSSPHGDAYLDTDTKDFDKERDTIVQSVLGIDLKKYTGINTTQGSIVKTKPKKKSKKATL